ncbi:MAG TPA: PQQ-binding-like beta-propeller repeat protein [Verrucomicrobiae bacterium]|nr:PQQ-binding-like beta-propeller repeat protein [Verrucomicrobiae bacterium]
MSYPTETPSSTLHAWCAIAFCLALSGGHARGEQASRGGGGYDWPCWRGPHRNGISAERGLNWAWAPEGPRVLWKASVGKGFSSFAITRGKAYTLGNTGNADTIFCLDAETGKEIWKHSYPCPLQPLSYEGGPSATPAIDNGKAFTISKSGHCLCLDAATGRIVWSKDFDPPPTTKQDYRVWWGFAGSPLIMGDRLILAVGSAGAALDKATGRVAWDNGPGRPGYSSPVPFQRGPEQALAFLSGHEIVTVRANDGGVLARVPWRTTWDQNAPDVIVAAQKLFVSTGHGVGCALFDIAPAIPLQLWRNKNLRSRLSTPVLWKGHLYGFDDNRLACLDWNTGETRWTADDTRQGSLIIADEKLIALQEDGTLLVAGASGEGYRPLIKARVLDGRCWTSPVLSGGRIFVRNAEGAVACLDLR